MKIVEISDNLEIHKFTTQFDSIDFEEICALDIFYCTPWQTSKGFTPLMCLFMKSDKTHSELTEEGIVGFNYKKYSLEFLEEYAQKNYEYINKYTAIGWNILMMLCINLECISNSEKKIKILLNNKHTDLNLAGRYGITALFFLCHNLIENDISNENLFKCFIQHENIDLNKKNDFKENILLFLSYRLPNSYKYLKLLLLNKSNYLDINTKTGSSALSKCIYRDISNNQKAEIFQLFLTNKTCKLDFEYNHMDTLINGKIQLINTFRLYKNIPSEDFYEFKTKEYFNINFVYLDNNILKRKYY